VREVHGQQQVVDLAEVRVRLWDEPTFMVEVGGRVGLYKAGIRSNSFEFV
jgi:hypothetical protein